MRSSQILEVEFDATVQCGFCGFDGRVEVWADPEVHASGWECPDCAAEHVAGLHDWDRGA